jgi:hypothetical protein
MAMPEGHKSTLYAKRFADIRYLRRRFFTHSSNDGNAKSRASFSSTPC